MTNKQHIRRGVAGLLAVVMLFSLVPAAFAAQENGYHDPAEHWLTANNRTNELDANAVVTRETGTCYECGKATSFEVFRTPEYTRDGQSALLRNVRYSDGTMLDGENKGSVNDGTPGKDAYYTGFHWTKAVCENCGTINSNMDAGDYGYARNVYWLYDCAAEFMEDLEESTSYEYADDTHHTKTVTGGSYCCFCYGTHHTEKSSLERHDLQREIVPELAHQRFTVKDAALHGWIFGYGDGTFRGERSITRAEVVAIVNRLLGRTADEKYITANLRRLNTFTDMEKGHWAYYDVMEAANSHSADMTDTEEWGR